MYKKLFFALGILFSASLSARALNDTTILLDNVVVTATRTRVNRNNIPMTISVVGRHEIEQSSESALLPVLSQLVPGLFVSQSGITGFGLSTGGGTLNIRGVGQGNKVLMMIDGQPQWAGLFGHSIPDFFVASDVERVEVVRGPASLVYGSNAMGGLVNVLTREQQTEQSTLNARIMYGSHNTQKYMVNSGYKKGRWSSFLSVNHDRTDGHRANSHFHITNGFGKLGYKISDRFDAVANVSLAGFAGRNPGPTGDNPLLDNTYDALRGTASLALDNKFYKASGSVRFFFNFGNHIINDGFYPNSPNAAERDPKTYLFRSHDHNYGVLAYESFSLFTRNSFTAGIDYKNWGGRAWNQPFEGPNTNGNIIDKSVDEIAGYLVMQQGIGSKVNLNSGLRLEHNSTFGNQFIPQAGVTYNPVTGTALKASVSKGFRSPNIRELYMFRPANLDLKPEHMLNYEVSVGQNFLQGKLYAEATAFLINARNIISTAIIDGKPLNINTGKFINRGVEAEITLRASKDLILKANYSYLYRGVPILAAPKNQLFVSATYNPGRFSLNLNLQEIANLYTFVNTNNPSANKSESYTLLNARAAYTFGKKQHFTVFVKGENLTDQKYSINYQFPMPGVTVFAGIDIPLVLKKY